MKKLSKRLIIVSMLIALILSIIAIGIFTSISNNSYESKILFEYNKGGAIAVSNDISAVPADAYVEDDAFSMQIMFNYEPYSDDLYEKQSAKGESFVEYSKRYHTAKNQEFVSKINTENLDVFVSEYTPYIFIDCPSDTDLNEVYTYTNSIVANDFIKEIRIYPSSIYTLDIDALYGSEEKNSNPERGVVLPPIPDLPEPINYENFPTGTPYDGSGIKIGILETGTFDPEHPNFSSITAEVVYDTNNTEDDHPNYVASIIGGRYGYAPAASLYFADVNSEDGYASIERLVNKGCQIVNMSFSANSCNNNGEYDTGLEGYLDYIYTSTKIIMVASASNTLNKEGTGGYVALPALCANVISVGSVDASGIPSDFSSYNIKNDVNSNPNLVAMGSERQIGNVGAKSGTSFSAPAVTGAIALYFDKNGVKELPAVLAILSATANDSIINKTTQTIDMLRFDSSTGEYVETGEQINCSNILKSNGSRKRTGAGMLDVTALLNYSNTLINYEITFTSDDFVELKQVYLSEGQTIRIALAWQRNATLTIEEFLWWETERIYSSDTLADFDLYLYNSSGTFKSSSRAGNTNVEIITYTADASGYYVIKLKPYSNYADTHNINYAYVIS